MHEEPADAVPSEPNEAYRRYFTLALLLLARARVFEPCKGCVLACFGAPYFTSIRFMVQVSDIACRTIGFVLLMYPLYG